MTELKLLSTPDPACFLRSTGSKTASQDQGMLNRRVFFYVLRATIYWRRKAASRLASYFSHRRGIICPTRQNATARGTASPNVSSSCNCGREKIFVGARLLCTAVLSCSHHHHPSLRTTMLVNDRITRRSRAPLDPSNNQGRDPASASTPCRPL